MYVYPGEKFYSPTIVVPPVCLHLFLKKLMIYTIILGFATVGM